jgi:hypothetical protein
MQAAEKELRNLHPGKLVFESGKQSSTLPTASFGVYSRILLSAGRMKNFKNFSAMSHKIYYGRLMRREIYGLKFSA